MVGRLTGRLAPRRGAVWDQHARNEVLHRRTVAAARKTPSWACTEVRIVHARSAWPSRREITAIGTSCMCMTLVGVPDGPKIHCRDTLPYPQRLAIDTGDVLNDLESETISATVGRAAPARGSFLW